jgi:hypothetical protein
MKHFLSILISSLISFNAFSADPTTINFCTNTTNTIEQAELLNCNELTVNNATYNIQSLTIGFEANGNYYEQTITGNVIPQSFLNNIQTYSPSVLFIENIILIDNNNQEKELKPIRVKVTN